MNGAKVKVIGICVSLIAVLVLPHLSLGVSTGDLAGLWLFDEGGGSVASDSSGNGNDAEVADAVGWIDGVFGGALEFDGSDNYATVPHEPIFDFGADGDFSMGCWMDAETDDAYVVTKRGSGPTVLWGLTCSMDVNTGSFVFQGYNDGDNRMVIGETVIQGEGWFHCVAVREDGVISLYVNGELETELDAPISIDSDAPIQMGGYPGENHIGGLDELFISKVGVALNQDDIRSIFENGWGGLTAVSPADRLATSWGTIKAQ